MNKIYFLTMLIVSSMALAETQIKKRGGSAVTPPDPIEDKSSWTFYESDDVIDGYWSVVTGTDLLGRELAFYSDGRLVVRNGDGYILSLIHI